MSDFGGNAGLFYPRILPWNSRSSQEASHINPVSTYAVERSFSMHEEA